MTLAPNVGAQPVTLGLCATETTSATIADAIQVRPLTCTFRRIDCNWWTNQATGPPGGTQPGGWDTLTSTAMDATVDAAAKAGKKLVLCASYTPPWAGGNGTDGHNYPHDPANGYRDYANFVYVAAKRCEARHPGTVVAWELWNEPNNGFLQPTSVTEYGNMLQTAYVLCRTGVLLGRQNRTPLPTTVQVWSGGTGAAPPVGSPNRHLNWSRALLQRSTRCLDGVGIHAYSGACPLGSANGYDPATNDIPGIHTAILAVTWSGGGSAIQIHDTESGYFHRDDTTSTNTTDTANCFSYGTGPNPNEKIEVTVTRAASRLTSHWAWWQKNAVAYNLGLSFYYQQDTTAPNNTDPNAAYGHAGLYTYSTTRTGTPTLDVNGTPALVNAFDTAHGFPSLSFPLYCAFGGGLPSTADVDAAIAAGIKGFRCGFLDWDTGDPTFAGTYTPKQNHIDIINYMNSKNFGLILQVSIGATFGGTAYTRGAGQGYNHTARAEDVNGVPYGPVVDVPVQLSKFTVNVGKYFDGSTPQRPLVRYLEIFNETNHFRFDDPAHSGVAANQKGAAYLEYLARIYPELKAARPDLTIYTGGLGGHQDDAQDRDALLFTQDLFAASFVYNAHTYSVATDRLFDRYNFHAYCYPSLPSADTSLGWYRMKLTMAFLAANGYCSTKWANTEWGDPVPWPLGTTHTYQDSANATIDACREWNKLPQGGAGGMPLCKFSWKDNDTGLLKGKSWGLVDPNGVPHEPLYSTVKALSAKQVANPPPSLLCYSPNSGPPAGGTALTVNGTFFAGASVTVGGTACTSVVITNGGQTLTCITPAHTAGIVPMVITTTYGTSTPTDFQYGTTQAGNPTVTGLAPTSGTIAGGTQVVITGANFGTVVPTNPAAVKFGAANAASFTVDFPTQITAISSPATPGLVNVTVTNPTGTSIIGPVSVYTFLSAPPVLTILAVSLADGTVYNDFTNPVNVRGPIGIAWSATDDVDPTLNTWIEKTDGTFLVIGTPGFGLYGAAYDTAQLPAGIIQIHAAAVDTDGNRAVSPPVSLNIVTVQAGHGLFAVPFYTIYTIPGNPQSSPNVVILAADPNPILPSSP